MKINLVFVLAVLTSGSLVYASDLPGASNLQPGQSTVLCKQGVDPTMAAAELNSYLYNTQNNVTFVHIADSTFALHFSPPYTVSAPALVKNDNSSRKSIVMNLKDGWTACVTVTKQ